MELPLRSATSIGIKSGAETEGERGAAAMRDDLRLELLKLAEKWDSAEYAIEQVRNPLLPQEQCAVEIRELLERIAVEQQAGRGK